jgi:adenylate cyclase class 2
MENTEIEVRFLEIDKSALVEKLIKLKANDLGPDKYHEIVFYDRDLSWQKEGKRFVRLRQTRNNTFLTYKDHHTLSATGTTEVEIEVNDFNKTKDLLTAIGLIAYREQEKKCHNFKVGDVIVGFDTWPGLPTYVELEGPSEQHLKDLAAKLGLDWEKAVYENAKVVIEKYYNIPVGTYRIYTFDKME